MAPRAALALLLACGPESGDSDTQATQATGTSGSGQTTDTTDSGPVTTSATTTMSASATGDPSSETDPTAGPSGPECQRDSDCVLIDNCCECDAKPTGAEVEACDSNCLVSTCTARSLAGIEVACRSGVCEFANVDCGVESVNCDAPEPQCPEGAVISVKDGCWGPCVPPRYCDGNACDGDSCGEGWMCVDSQSGTTTCAVIPRECGGEPTCDCIAPYLDQFCGGGCFDDGGPVCADGG